MSETLAHISDLHLGRDAAADAAAEALRDALLGWPHADEVAGGGDVVDALRGRCDLVLHGHRHRAAEVAIPARAGRALRVLNAGATPALGRARLVTHEAGRVVAERWLAFASGRRAAPAAPARARAAA